MEEGRFREDLFYRMHVTACHVRLCANGAKTSRLVDHFIRKLGPRTNPGIRCIEDAALARLAAYNWPGNVRELENAVEQSWSSPTRQHWCGRAARLPARGSQ